MENLSPFETHAIDVMASNDAERDTLLAQLAVAQCRARDYTGCGMFVELVVPPTAPRVDLARWQIQDMLIGHAVHPALPDGAGLILWLTDGWIRCLECYACQGDWPGDTSLFRVMPNAIPVPAPRSAWRRFFRRP